jgi:SAM-dependent methyltransferase
MKKEYEDLINRHYNEIAIKDGLSPSSTMPDEITRSIETDVITDFVADVIQFKNRENGSFKQLVIGDIGCGNGYTLEVLANKFKEHKFIGIEKSSDLRALANSRFIGSEQVEVIAGDICEPHFAQDRSMDIIICQRVIINILDKNDQKIALNNIVHSVVPGGKLLFIEAFTTPLMKLNAARAEFDLPPISPAYHNCYLNDNFFIRPDLNIYRTEGWHVDSNFLSTHYYISRVLHPLLSQSKPSTRNTAFVKFFSKALPPAIGDFSQLKIYAFEKVSISS